MGLFLNKIKEGKILVIIPDNICTEWIYEVTYNDNKFIVKELHLDYVTDLLSEEEIHNEIELFELINSSYYYFKD